LDIRLSQQILDVIKHVAVAHDNFVFQQYSSPVLCARNTPTSSEKMLFMSPGSRKENKAPFNSLIFSNIFCQNYQSQKWDVFETMCITDFVSLQFVCETSRTKDTYSYNRYTALQKSEHYINKMRQFIHSLPK